MIVAIQNIMSFLPHKQVTQVLIQNTIANSDFYRFPNQKTFSLKTALLYLCILVNFQSEKH